ncbi:hypothetical protein [Nonomuraea sp. NPDC048916]|uniref:hypothetical protein n=1 Tax=Nonomuraea sp. NPDC048916 TaxID=3154232 RepID=UPI0033F30DE5
MDYGGRERFITGATLATAGAALIGQPVGFYIASFLWTLVANPDTMTEAKEKWQTNTELAALQKSVTSLAERLETVADWEGGTAEIVRPMLKNFVKETEELGQHRVGMGNLLGSSAKYYNGLSWVVLAVGTAMMAMGVASIASKVHPVTAAAVRATVTASLQALWTSIKGLRPHLLKFAMVAGFLYLGIHTLTAEQGMKFQDMKAGMRYQNLKLANDPTTGAPTPNTDIPNLA